MRCGFDRSSLLPGVISVAERMLSLQGEAEDGGCVVIGDEVEPDVEGAVDPRARG